ncbi:MAG: helix-turn-helix transcriptional regulator [Defluviitaleaceae bacterium]|nr:helix-turn-helix transcriptional regulator [Defluviitaleaceae bacterium]
MTQAQKEHIVKSRSKGESYAKIAADLGVSENTVKSHCRRMNQKTVDKSDVCQQCGKVLIHIPHKKKKIFCSDKCRFAWWNTSKCNPAHQTSCTHCGGTFDTRGNSSRKYCSHACYIAGRYGGGGRD